MTPQPPAHPLAQALAAGQPGVFAALYDRLAPSMLRVASAMLGRREGAEDAVQEVFVSLARRRHRMAEVEDIDAYVFASLRYAITARQAAEKRDLRRLQQHALSIGTGCQSPPELQEDWDVHLADLPADQREVVVLKIDGGLTFAQIAQVLGIRPNTAASRYRYAIEKLRQKFEKEP